MYNWNEKVSLFFLEYIHPGNKEAYTPSGNLNYKAIKDAVSLLLKEKVFDSPEDMRHQAIKDYGIILPDYIFEGVKIDGRA